jgi:hypothetical protein
VLSTDNWTYDYAIKCIFTRRSSQIDTANTTLPFSKNEQKRAKTIHNKIRDSQSSFALGSFVRMPDLVMSICGCGFANKGWRA